MCVHDQETNPGLLICHRCGAQLTAGDGSFYIVNIEAFADPTPPRIDTDEPIESIAADIDDLVRRMKDFSEQELMDQVYRRLTLTLCAPCHQTWMDNPTA